MIRSTDCTVTPRAEASVKVTGIDGAVSPTASTVTGALAVVDGSAAGVLVVLDPHPTAMRTHRTIPAVLLRCRRPLTTSSDNGQNIDVKLT